jgi:type IV pilus assembly protein PilY1
MKHCLAKLVLASTLVLGCWQAQAEDIDLFVDDTSSPTDRPNILFILDNTGNWNTAFNNERDALASVISNLPVDSFNVGLMMFGEPQVGYVRAAIRPMTAANKAIYANLVSSFGQVADRESARTLGRTISEAHRYLTGQVSTDPAVLLGKAKRDYAGNTSGTVQSNAVYALAGNALSDSSETTYTSPLDATSCARTYIIYIGNTVPSGNVVVDNSARNALAGAELAAAGGSTVQIPLPYDAHEENFADEWARFLKQDLGITFYTIDVDPTPMPPLAGHINGRGNSALLDSMATVTGGRYFRVNSGVGGGSQIIDALTDVFSEIQAVNSVFASVSLPLSANQQGFYLNQIFVAVFRPDEDAYPRWYGNLKQYKIGFTNSELVLQDADSNAAVNSLTGFVTECARSFWTPSSPDDYWAFSPRGSCIPPAGQPANYYQVSNFPDGSSVEKGGQAYVLRGSIARPLKTCSPTLTLCTTLTNFAVANADITQASLAAGSSAERDALINWAYGLDIDDEDNDTFTTQEMRPSAHGDVIHSRPVAINFGTDAAPQVVVFYGGNDGVFRAINGNRSTSIGSVPPGAELWGFVPPEFYGQFKRLRDNTTQISFPLVASIPPPPASLPKPYAMDGAITAHVDGGDAWVYASMRRGGRMLYSFNVNPANPADITFKWKVGCMDNFTISGTVSDANCTTGFTGIGQTWSAPRSFKAQGYSSGTAPLLIMGGGYDPCEDANPNTCTASTKGNKVYVLDADAGTLLQTLTTDRSVIAEVMVVPDAATGLASYAYVSDLGGNVYRINIGAAAPGSWAITKIASLGCDTTASCTDNRKFMFMPDVVREGNDLVLLLGSGDREKPREYNNPIANYFYMIRDRPTDATWLSSEATNCGSAVLCTASLLSIASTTTPTTPDLATKKGWYLALEPTEQVVNAAITLFGKVTFSTHQPVQYVAGSCSSDLGTARVYNIRYLNAERANPIDPNAPIPNQRYELLPPLIGLAPNAVVVTTQLDSGEIITASIGSCGPLCLDEGVPPPGLIPVQPRSRVYWYIER